MRRADHTWPDIERVEPVADWLTRSLAYAAGYRACAVTMLKQVDGHLTCAIRMWLKQLGTYLGQQHEQQRGKWSKNQRQHKPEQTIAILALRQRGIDQRQRAPANKPRRAIGQRQIMIHCGSPNHFRSVAVARRLA